MKKEQRQFYPGTYTPRRLKNYYLRVNVENQYRKLYLEANKTEYKSDLSYWSDGELLRNLNHLLHQLGLLTMEPAELDRELSLKY